MGHSSLQELEVEDGGEGVDMASVQMRDAATYVHHLQILLVAVAKVVCLLTLVVADKALDWHHLSNTMRPAI